MGRVSGDFRAEKMMTQRCLIGLLTYRDEYLREAGREPEEFLQDIPAAAADGSKFVAAFRANFRRLHPDLRLNLKSYRVPEIAQHRTDRGIDPGASYAEYLREMQRPRELDRPARVHLHYALFMSVEWKDAERQSREPAQWRDDLIPHLKVGGFLYDHWWETKAEAKARGGRVCKTVRPWPWGFMSYENPLGGEGEYFAKYISKCMNMREEYVKQKDSRAWSYQKQLDYERAEESWKNTRRSPRIGAAFYALQGECTARAGLPPSLYFEFGRPINAVAVSCPSHDMAGEVYLRKVREFTGRHELDQFGRLVEVTATRKVLPCAILQRVGRCRPYIEAYDRAWRELYGEAPQPVGSSMRRKVTGTGTGGDFRRERPIVAYGVSEARAVIAKDDDRRVIGKRDRLLARRLRELRRKYPEDMTRAQRKEMFASPLWLEAAKLGHELLLRELVERASKPDPYALRAGSPGNSAYGVTAEVLRLRDRRAMEPDRLDDKLRRMGNRKGIGYEPERAAEAA